MITEIKINSDEFSQYRYDSKDATIINKLTRVNIFIGPNNSGKSRFMRGLFSADMLKYTYPPFNLQELELIKENLIKDIDAVIVHQRLHDTFNVKKTCEQLPVPKYVSDNFEAEIEVFLGEVKKISNFYGNGNNQIRNIDNNWVSSSHIHQSISEKVNMAVTAINTYKKEKTKFFKYQKIYIPILRGLRPIQISENSELSFDGTKDSYKDRTRWDYFKENKNKEKISDGIYTGLGIYKDIRDKLLNKKSDRENVKAFEDFLHKNFFSDKKEFTLIPHVDNDVLYVGMGDGDERFVYQLGDGIQSIVQILYPIFLNKTKNTLFFIEEPELNLHPGMQRILLDVLSSDEFEGMQFFITTHSNHFLDLSFDNKNVSIYKFNKKSETEFTIKNLSNPDNEVLKDLGVLNSSVFLSNCTIWVEGITDRRYIRKFLELYTKKHPDSEYIKYKEDLHYSFIEYAGSNIVHWNFDEEGEEEKISALKINNNIFLIVDSDVSKNGIRENVKEERHNELKKILQKNLYITEGKRNRESLKSKYN